MKHNMPETYTTRGTVISLRNVNQHVVVIGAMPVTISTLDVQTASHLALGANALDRRRLISRVRNSSRLTTSDQPRRDPP